MKLNKSILRKMILSEVNILRENVDARIIAKQIAEKFGDTFTSENWLEAQIENQVYTELVEGGYINDSSPDFKLLDEVMSELDRLGVINEAGGKLTGAMTWLKKIIEDRPELVHASELQKKSLARNIKKQFPQLEREEAWGVVDTVISRMGGGVESDEGPGDIVTLIMPHLPTDKGAMIKLVKDKSALGTLTQQLWRSEDLDNFEPSAIRRGIIDALIKKLGIKKESKLTRGSLRSMILSELKKRK